MIMIAVACLIYIWLTQKRNMREAASVGIWAFIAIAIRQWNAYKDIALTAIIASVILLILVSIHAYKGRYYAPFVKLKRGEW
jgi:ABC-type iron transport system FetAB permease component